MGFPWGKIFIHDMHMLTITHTWMQRAYAKPGITLMKGKNVFSSISVCVGGEWSITLLDFLTVYISLPIWAIEFDGH